MPSAETENEHQIVFKPRLVPIAPLAGGDNRQLITAIRKEEFPAYDVISRRRCRLDAVHARLSFVFLVHSPKCKCFAYRHRARIPTDAVSKINRKSSPGLVALPRLIRIDFRFVYVASLASKIPRFCMGSNYLSASISSIIWKESCILGFSGSKHGRTYSSKIC